MWSIEPRRSSVSSTSVNWIRLSIALIRASDRLIEMGRYFFPLPNLYSDLARS
jgi:hypothetical protein